MTIAVPDVEACEREQDLDLDELLLLDPEEIQRQVDELLSGDGQP